jgi:hypothetical protein
MIGGVPAPYPMPKYHAMLTDEQIADVLTFVRGSSNNDALAVNAKAVEKVRSATRAPWMFAQHAYPQCQSISNHRLQIIQADSL